MITVILTSSIVKLALSGQDKGILQFAIFCSLKKLANGSIPICARRG